MSIVNKNKLDNGISHASRMLLQKLLDNLRGGLSEEDATILGLAILAWGKLSADPSLPEDISAYQGRFSSSAELVSRLREAIETMDASHQSGLHNPPLIVEKYGSISLSKLEEAVEIAGRLAKRGDLRCFVPPLDFYRSRLGIGSGATPDEVVNLMTMLAIDKSAEDIYCPYDDYARFTTCAALLGAEAHLGSSQFTVVPKLNRILSGLSYDIALGDAQNFSEKSAGDRSFDSAVAFVPWGKLSRSTDILPIGSEPFSKKTASITVHVIAWLLRRSRRKVVVAVYNGFLVGRSAELELTKRLIDQGMLEGVISMPPALLPYTELPFSILVLNPQGGEKTVRFVEGSDDQFFSKDGRNRAKLEAWQSLLEMYQNGGSDSIVQDVSTEKIIENNYQLEPLRYVLSKELKQAYSYTQTLPEQYTVGKLGDYVETIRPYLKLYKEGAVLAKEAMTADFPDFGYLTEPTKEVLFSPSTLEETELRRLFLRPHDIVITVKGMTGAVAIAPPNTPTPGEGGWLANQSCLILRVRKKQIVPVYLFMYLSSEAGQTLLKQISTGASTALIQLQPLKNLPVPVPPLEEMSAITQAFHQQVDLQQKINQLQAEQIRLRKTHWSIES